MKNNLPKINGIVDYLDKNDRNEIKLLESEYPEFKHLLKPGIIMGNEETYSEEAEYKFRLDVTKRGLSSALKKGNNLFQELTARLKRLNNIDFYSQVITLISGSAVLVMFVKGNLDSLQELKYIAPILVLFSSLLSLYTKNKAKSFIGGNEDLYKLTNNFIGYKIEGDYLLKELDVAIKHFSLEKAKRIVETSNNIIKNIDAFNLRAS